MKIIYNVTTKVLVSCEGEHRLPVAGEAAAEGSFMPMDREPRYYLYNGTFVVPRDENEVFREIAAEAFNVELFEGALFAALLGDALSTSALRSEFAILKSFVTGTKRFDLMKQYLAWLVLKEVATEADVTVISGILLQQQIDLTTY